MSNFEKAIEVVLAHEGGYVNNPVDPGGETKYGISKRSYPNVDIKNLTIAQAKQIYLTDFWQPYPFDKIANDAFATKLFDTSVNVGSKRAFKFVQTALNQMDENVVVDGVIGPKTLSLINDLDNNVLLNVYRAVQAEYYKGLVTADPKKAVFLRGWLIRAAE
jgi:lysozyme family protein